MMSEMELQVIEKVQKFSWNFDAVKAELSNYIQKYSGLVVADENLPDMEKTQKEVAGLRIKLSKFRAAVKKELEKPYLDFEVQVKELLTLVESAEQPIKDQLEKYEIRRREEKSHYCQKLINGISDEMGLDAKYREQIVIADKWLNRTQKASDTKEDIQLKVCWLLDIQRKDKESADFKAQKIDMAKFLCESLSIGLVTPLTFAEIESRVDSFDIAGLKAHIEAEVARRKEREERAAQIAIERSQPVPPPTAPPAPAEHSKVIPLANEKRYDAQIVVYGVTETECKDIARFLEINGIKFKTAVKAVA